MKPRWRVESSREVHSPAPRDRSADEGDRPREKAAALREQARTGKAAEVEKLDREQESLEHEADRERATAEAATEAIKNVQREIEALHRDEFEALREHAEAQTAEAQKAMEV